MNNRLLEVVKNEQRILQINTSETSLPSMDVADNVNYDNTESGLESTNVQDAIDELAATKEILFTQEVKDVLDQTTAPFTMELSDKLYGFQDAENYLTINTIVTGDSNGLIVGGGSLSGNVSDLNVDLSRLVKDGVNGASPDDYIPIIRADGTQTKLEAKNIITDSGFKFVGYVKSDPTNPARMELCDRHRIGSGSFIDKNTPPPANANRPSRDGYAYEILLSDQEDQTGYTSTIYGNDDYEPVVMYSHDILVWTSVDNVTDDGYWVVVESGARIKNFNGRNGVITPQLGDYQANQIYYDDSATTTVKSEIDLKAKLKGGNLFVGEQVFDEGVILQPMVELPEGTTGQMICATDENGTEAVYSFVNNKWTPIGTGGTGGADVALGQVITELQEELNSEKLKVVALEEKIEELEAKAKTVVRNFSSVKAPTVEESNEGDTWIDTLNKLYYVRIDDIWVPILTGV